MHELPVYPPDHKVGMEVPEGGSNCDKCKHLAGPQKCDDKEFVEWNGSDRIPVATSRYCCDFFKTGEKKRRGFGARLGEA
jgi:hypothetical protein